MSLKHFLPSFRNRYRFVIKHIEAITKENPCTKMLNLGTGEGDYDSALAKYTKELMSCDINATEIELARQINKHVSNLTYEVQNALSTTYMDGQFDIIVNTEVIEHVGNPDAMLKEVSRLVRSGGCVVMTFPSRAFPFTYDPFNYIAQKLGFTPPFIRQGAYSFGHEYLIDYNEFSHLAKSHAFQITTYAPLSGYLIGFLEMYWTGLFQYLTKGNRKNLSEYNDHALIIRPKTSKIPRLVFITDFIIKIDRMFFTGMRHSVGKGLVLLKI